MCFAFVRWHIVRRPFVRWHIVLRTCAVARCAAARCAGRQTGRLRLASMPWPLGSQGPLSYLGNQGPRFQAQSPPRVSNRSTPRAECLEMAVGMALPQHPRPRPWYLVRRPFLCGGTLCRREGLPLGVPPLRPRVACQAIRGRYRTALAMGKSRRVALMSYSIYYAVCVCDVCVYALSLSAVAPMRFLNASGLPRLCSRGDAVSRG